MQVLRCIKPPALDHVVLGQYTAAQGEDGYLDDPTVPQGSKTPTFASIVLYINNDRWAGVPFIIKAGKALDERKAEIRIQLQETPHFIFAGNSDSSRNELVVRLQPDEAIYMKFIVKKPGLRCGRALQGGGQFPWAMAVMFLCVFVFGCWWWCACGVEEGVHREA